MFERFTERARLVIQLAQDEARGLRHNYIGTEHLLLGLIREEEGLASRVLTSLDITFDEVKQQIARLVGQGDEPVTAQIPFTPRAKKVLELALREALSLGHNYIGTEHVLLGLVRENEGVAARILHDFDTDAEKIRNEVIRMLAGPGRARREEKRVAAVEALQANAAQLNRLQLQAIRTKAQATAQNQDLDGSWRAAYLELAWAADRLDAMFARHEVEQAEAAAKPAEPEAEAS